MSNLFFRDSALENIRFDGGTAWFWEYIPKRFRLDGHHEPTHDILALKNPGARGLKGQEYQRALKNFAGRVGEFLKPGIAIVIVPSSNPERGNNSGIGRLAQLLAQSGRHDGTRCLLRLEAVAPKHRAGAGGRRSLADDLRTIGTTSLESIRGKPVLLLDDVVTSGDSLRACAEILAGAGVEPVQCVALTRTARRGFWVRAQAPAAPKAHSIPDESKDSEAIRDIRVNWESVESQGRAGFMIGGLRDQMLKGADARYWQGVMDHLTTYDRVIEGAPCPPPTDHSILAVAFNLIGRGLPALPSCRVERAVMEVIGGKDGAVGPVGEIHFEAFDDLAVDQIRALASALAPVDLDHERGELRSADSEAEQTFYREILPQLIGEPLTRLAEAQRPMWTLLDEAQAEKFDLQRVDFAVEWPLDRDGFRGVVIELDGIQHADPKQEQLDRRRDQALSRARWHVLRVDARSWQPTSKDADQVLEAIQRHRYVLALNAWKAGPPAPKSKHRGLALAAWIPLAVARIQHSLVQLALEGYLDPNASSWRIAIVERDVPCGLLAIQDLEDLLGRLSSLADHWVPPKIECTVYPGGQTGEEKRGDPGAVPVATSNDRSGDYDVVMDCSLWRRGPETFPETSAFPRAKCFVSLRSARWPRVSRHLWPAAPVVYERAGEAAAVSELRGFLQDWFRKEEFREGQLEIIQQALQGQSVIGLLPTGAGKSLCYQFCALMQPGMCVVVSPLKALMRDQAQNLAAAGLDSVAFVSSDLNAKERQAVQQTIQNGEHQFVFVSPERFQIQGFRSVMSELAVPVTYAVVDEAHCVSEWGHDFRTAYLRLGENLRENCEADWGKVLPSAELPVLALTGTASFDVLSDVRRELGLRDQVKEVRPATFERKELQLEVVDVESPPEAQYAQGYEQKKAVFGAKKQMVSTILAQIHRDGVDPREKRGGYFGLRGKTTNSAVVFTPHANGVLGVRDLRADLRAQDQDLFAVAGTFASSDKGATADGLIQTQNQFKENDLAILYATKAFGMGIDKPNIRVVIHTNIPASIESYYQEAGRAGRDRQTAICKVLYCRQRLSQDERAMTVDREVLEFFHQSSFKGASQEKRVLYDLLRGGGARYPTGIQQVMSELDSDGAGAILRIPFGDESPKKEICEYLRARVREEFTENSVSHACRDSHRSTELTANLDKHFKKTTGNRLAVDWDPHEQWLQNQWERIRNSQDTAKAVYRLSIIGVIQDYVVDYRANEFDALVVRMKPGDYCRALQKYIERYVSPEDARLVVEKAQAAAGQNEVQKCLGFLVDFVYSSIAKKRREAIAVMEEACRLGVEEGNEAFRSRVNTYFDSRYTPLLQPYQRNYNIEVVWQFIEETGGQVDAIAHLRGACDRLLASNPENGAYLLLRAYARCLGDRSNVQEFKDDFRRGWASFRGPQKMSRREYVEAMGNFYSKVEVADSEAVELIGDELVLAHTEWLTELNDRISESVEIK